LSIADLPGARDLRAAPTRITGWVAVSASKLTAYDRRRLSWLRAYCPVDVLARTVLVYRFDAPPDRTIVGPDAPARECRRSLQRADVGHVAGLGFPWSRNTVVTSRCSTTWADGSVFVHAVSGGVCSLTRDRLTTT